MSCRRFATVKHESYLLSVLGELSGQVWHKLGGSWASLGASCGGLVPPWGGPGESWGGLGFSCKGIGTSLEDFVGSWGAWGGLGPPVGRLRRGAVGRPQTN